MSNTKPTSLTCPACGGKIEPDVSQQTSVCPYCGTKFSTDDLLGTSDAVKIEKVKTEAYKDVEKEKLKYEAEKEKRQKDNENINSFKKSKFSKILIIFAVLCALACFMSFSHGKILAGFIAIIQTAAFITAWLMGMQIIKTKKQNIHSAIAIIGFILIVPFMAFNSQQSHKSNPVVMTEIQWPSSEVAQLLPVPELTQGNIIYDSPDSFYVKIGKVTKEQYDEYVSKCEEKGFTVDYYKSDTYYSANNEAGYHLSLQYQDNNVMSISISTPQEEVDTTPAETIESEEDENAMTNQNQTDSSVSSDFKAAMDSYEAFFDEYIAFMHKYQNSDNAVSMLSDYATYMAKYTETTQKLNDINTDELSVADSAYYLEVQTRITQKLLSVTQ